MFDNSVVDLNRDPNFYIDIKNEVESVCSSWGMIERIYIEQESLGNVWIKFGGKDALQNSETTRN